MYISKTRFINWTRCPMYFALDLKHNPGKKTDIDAERERREEIMAELLAGMSSSSSEYEDNEEFDATSSEELEALLPYYNQVEDEALKVAQKYFRGTFVADYKDVHRQKLFEYKRGDHVYRCYVDIYNENDEEINIIEVKATTCKKFADMKFSIGNKEYFKLFVKDGNIYRLNPSASSLSEKQSEKFVKSKAKLLNRYSSEGKYPHDIAFQKWVIEHALCETGDSRPVNFYLAVLNNEYVYDGATDANGKPVYNEIKGQDVITFINMNETAEEYQSSIKKEIATLESYIETPHDIKAKCDVGHWCAWGANTECVFWKHCYQTLRNVPDSNSANKYLYSGNTNWNGIYKGKYALVNGGLYSMKDIDQEWLQNENHLIQRECLDSGIEYIDKEKMQMWIDKLDYPIYHFDFEAFPCPLPRFKGESPYRQSVFEFSLHIEREPGVCDKEKDNVIFLAEDCVTDCREDLAKAIVEHFEFDENDNLKGTMLAQNTSYEQGRLTELAELFPEYAPKLLAIRDKSADLIHLLKTDGSDGLYKQWGFDTERCKTINYYHKDLSGSYSIKKTLPVLVPNLSYDEMKKHTVSNGVQAYATYLNYDAEPGTTRDMDTKEERIHALRLYCQQDTWAMVEILKAVRKTLITYKII